uniref:Uncharacterized protein n=1 Tax=Rhizophora mucronata TaxID=61149 RepID=A0A2P2Q0Y7_RHIMU
MAIFLLTKNPPHLASSGRQTVLHVSYLDYQLSVDFQLVAHIDRLLGLSSTFV